MPRRTIASDFFYRVVLFEPILYKFINYSKVDHENSENRIDLDSSCRFVARSFLIIRKICELNIDFIYISTVIRSLDSRPLNICACLYANVVRGNNWFSIHSLWDETRTGSPDW